MSESLTLRPLLEGDDRSSPPPFSLAMVSSSQAPLCNTNIVRTEALLKSLGYPLRSLLREFGDSIPSREDTAVRLKVNEHGNSIEISKIEAPLPAHSLQRPPDDRNSTIQVENSAKSIGRLAESSSGNPTIVMDNHIRSLIRELGVSTPPREETVCLKVNDNGNSIEIPKIEAILPANILRCYPDDRNNTIQVENSAKSIGRDGAIVSDHLQSLLEDSLLEGTVCLKVNDNGNSFEIPIIEAPLPDPTLQSPPTQFENSNKSPGRNGAIVSDHLESMLKDSELPAESSQEKLTILLNSGMGEMMRVNSMGARRAALRRAEMGLRVSEVVLCLVSFSIMAADKTGGWAGDYFVRYQEYRYCFSVNVMAFVYSAFQVFSPLYYDIWKRHILSRPLRYSIDFLIDQVFAYLLMSSSSSAASRNDAWVSMFGSDKFTMMLIGSVLASFFAFIAFATSSIISAYKLFRWSP